MVASAAKTQMTVALISASKLVVRRLLSVIVRMILRLRSRPFPLLVNGPMVIIAPHQDDETLGCGGLLASAGRTARVEIIYLTDGQSSHPGHPVITPAALGARRRTEALAAMASFGLASHQLHFLNAADGTLSRLTPMATATFVNELASRLSAMQPARIFAPCRNDGSSEHDAAFALLTQALSALPSRPPLLEFPIWSWWNPLLLFGPACRCRRIWRLKFSAQAGQKRQALLTYTSQTEPIPPDLKPVLSSEFLGFFSSDTEYYLEY